MQLILYFCFAWLVLSVPLAVFVGRLCALNDRFASDAFGEDDFGREETAVISPSCSDPALDWNAYDPIARELG